MKGKEPSQVSIADRTVAYTLAKICDSVEAVEAWIELMDKMDRKVAK